MSVLTGDGLLHEEHFATALRLAKAGDRHGLLRLYRLFNRAVAAAALAVGHPDPDDLVNTVFYKAFRSIERFDGDAASFAVHLYQIAEFEFDRQDRDGSGAGEGRSAEKPTSACVEAMGSLTPEQREVIALRAFFGLTAAEVADAMQKPLNTVEWLQTRAEIRFRRTGLNETTSV